ncbi:MAG TPA: AraC family transcriptional regulator [Rhodothermales bacterium]|nr:AraC family transcriptional regulator [Rhodothermales bacterium]
MPAHAHPFPNVSIIIQGHLEEETPVGRAVGSASSVIVKPAKVVHENQFGPQGAILLNVQLDDDVHWGEMSTEGLKRWNWLHTGTATQEAIALLHDVADAAFDPATLVDAVYALLAALPESAPASGPPPPWLLRVRDRMMDMPSYPHRVDQLAADARVHPVYLARVFKQHFHTTITASLHHLRLRRATDQLASSDRSLADIAYEMGFADQSHFGRVFKSTFQTSPGAFRLLVRRFEEAEV